LHTAGVSSDDEYTLFPFILIKTLSDVDFFIKVTDNLNLKDKYGNTFLSQAILSGQMDIFHMLIENGADPNALHEAVRMNNDYAVEVLLKAGAIINKQDKYGSTPIYEVTCKASEKQLHIAKLLLDAGADPNIPRFSTYTPLINAIKEGNSELVELLLKAGANPNAKSDKIYTVMMHAMLWKDERIIKLLRQYGAR